MKLTEIKNERALDVLADIIEPASEILQDEKIMRVFSGKKFNRMETVRYLLKNHQVSIIKILAAMSGTPYEEYEFNIISGIAQVMDLLNDEALLSFFQQLGQTTSAEHSGSATEITTETGEK